MSIRFSQTESESDSAPGTPGPGPGVTPSVSLSGTVRVGHGPSPSQPECKTELAFLPHPSRARLHSSFSISHARPPRPPHRLPVRVGPLPAPGRHRPGRRAGAAAGPARGPMSPGLRVAGCDHPGMSAALSGSGSPLRQGLIMRPTMGDLAGPDAATGWAWPGRPDLKSVSFKLFQRLSFKNRR
jgi:hypothetical protein